MKSYEKITPDSLFSWLAPLHIECMNEAEYIALQKMFRELDIQSKKGQLEVINNIVVPEYKRANEISKNALKKILATAINEFSDKDLEKVFWEAGMPFQETITNKRGFLKNIWNEVFPEEDESAFCEK